MVGAKPKVALLVGGTSPEREVSKMSGEGIHKIFLPASAALITCS